MRMFFRQTGETVNDLAIFTFHHGTLFLGSMPLTPEGEWVFEYEAMAKKFPHRYFYLEASAIENIHILGEMYFRDLKRALPKVVYDLEVLNKRRKQNESGFYPLLSPEKHTYCDSFNYDYYDSMDYDIKEKVLLIAVVMLTACLNEPLYVSFDFGTTQNCIVVSQWHRHCNEFPVIKNFYVENETLTILLPSSLTTIQINHKTLYLYGGSDGNRRNDAASRNSYFDDVRDQLTKAGWEVYLRAELYEASQMDKYQFWHKFLSGELPILAEVSDQYEQCHGNICFHGQCTDPSTGIQER